jgi:2-aminoethylphosphonate dioxygenase
MNNTWSHAAARTLIRPLVGTWVRPNHITIVRLATGAMSCVLLAIGGSAAELWFGILWLISAFLDRADGELARVGHMQSRRGHLFDYYTDVALNSSFFLAAGINLRHSVLGGWAMPAGVVAGLAMLACCVLAETYETEVATGERIWEGGWGFQVDDALYLLPLFVWLHWLAPILVAAAVVTTLIALIILTRYVHLRRRMTISSITHQKPSADAPTGIAAPAAAPLAPEAGLTAEQRAHYASKAWVAVPGFFSAAETAQISAWVDELLHRPERPDVEMVYHEPKLSDPSVRLVQRIENFCPFHAEFGDLVQGRLKAAIETLIGRPAVLFKDKINFKMAGGAGFEAHQDQQAGWSVYAPVFVTALVSIDAATLANGCLEIADAPRLAGLIGEEWKPLTRTQMAGYPMMPITCEPGDVLFFDSFVPHASKTNDTDNARRILYLTYNAESYGDHRAQYFADKRANFPPDIERKPGSDYRFRV